MNGLKCSQADVKSELAELRTALLNLIEDFRREMQTCRRSGNGPRTFRKDGLVALPVRAFVGAINVRRQWNMPQAIEVLSDAPLIPRDELQRPEPEFATCNNLRFEFPCSKQEALALRHLSSRTHQRFPSVRRDLAGQKHFNLARQVFGPARLRWRLRMHTGAPPE